jgi:hypothetical protein
MRPASAAIKAARRTMQRNVYAAGMHGDDARTGEVVVKKNQAFRPGSLNPSMPSPAPPRRRHGALLYRRSTHRNSAEFRYAIMSRNAGRPTVPEFEYLSRILSKSIKDF